MTTEVRKISVFTNADSSTHPITLAASGASCVAGLNINREEAERMVFELQWYLDNA